jgi:hypothetical protein
MFARVSKYLHWITLGLTLPFLIFAASVLLFGSGDERWFLVIPSAIIGGVIWLIGRFCFSVADDIANS